MNLGAKTLLPLLLALSSTSLVACAASETETPESASTLALEASNACAAIPVVLGSTVAFTPPPAPASAPAPEAPAPETAPRTVLEVPGLGIHDVQAFDFSVLAEPSISQMGGLTIMKPTLSALTVRLSGKAKGGSLASRTVVGARMDRIRLLLAPPEGKKGEMTELATFGVVTTMKLSTDVDGGVADEIEFFYAQVSIGTSTNKVSLDRLTSGASLANPCAVPFYVQAEPGALLPEGATRIDRAEIAMSTSEVVGGGGVGKPVLDRMAVELPFDDSGICAVYRLARGRWDAKLSIGSMTTGGIDGNESVLTHRWDACVSTPSGVHFSGGGTAKVMQTIELIAGGVVRTDLGDGSPNATTSTSGWSFLTNKAITSCQPL